MIAKKRADPPPKRTSNLPARIILLFTLVGLVMVMIGVIWVLPRYVDQDTVPMVDVSPEQAKPATTPPTEEQTELARAKREAERALGGFLQRQAVLEGKEVTIWGGQDYEQVLLTLDAADAAFANGNFELAKTEYTAASTRLDDLESSMPQRLKQALAMAASALENYDAETAKHYYQIALSMEPQNTEALAGAKRAATLEQLAAWLTEAAESEQALNWAQALELYQQAAALDPQSTEAQAGVARANTEIAAQHFRSLMSTALEATKAGQLDSAKDALEEAAKLRPDSSDLREAQERLRLTVQEKRISTHRQRAATLVAAERWREAADEYDAVLTIDPQAQFAVQGLTRSKRQAKLHAQLDQYIAHPGRLQSGEPRANAKILLDTLRSMDQKGPRLSQKQKQLSAILELAETPVTVVLQSDEMTDVRIDRIGNLGRFKESTVTLLPGTYIVHGSRVGYRDVRLNLSVEVGAVIPTLLIQCEEKI